MRRSPMEAPSDETGRLSTPSCDLPAGSWQKRSGWMVVPYCYVPELLRLTRSPSVISSTSRISRWLRSYEPVASRLASRSTRLRPQPPESARAERPSNTSTYAMGSTGLVVDGASGLLCATWFAKLGTHCILLASRGMQRSVKNTNVTRPSFALRHAPSECWTPCGGVGGRRLPGSYTQATSATCSKAIKENRRSNFRPPDGRPREMEWRHRNACSAVR